MSIRNYRNDEITEQQEKWHNQKMRLYRETRIMLEIENLKIRNKMLQHEYENYITDYDEIV